MMGKGAKTIQEFDCKNNIIDQQKIAQKFYWFFFEVFDTWCHKWPQQLLYLGFNIEFAYHNQMAAMITLSPAIFWRSKHCSPILSWVH